MREILEQNPAIAILVLVIELLVILYFSIRIAQAIGMEKIRGYVYQLFVDAEHEFKHGDNKAKFEYVICLAKGAIPAPFNLLITEKLLRDVVQGWFNLCKDLLDDGKLNGTATEEE